MHSLRQETFLQYFFDEPTLRKSNRRSMPLPRLHSFLNVSMSDGQKH